jgi:hypothetical protein
LGVTAVALVPTVLLAIVERPGRTSARRAVDEFPADAALEAAAA